MLITLITFTLRRRIASSQTLQTHSLSPLPFTLTLTVGVAAAHHPLDPSSPKDLDSKVMDPVALRRMQRHTIIAGEELLRYNKIRKLHKSKKQTRQTQQRHLGIMK